MRKLAALFVFLVVSSAVAQQRRLQEVASAPELDVVDSCVLAGAAMQFVSGPPATFFCCIDDAQGQASMGWYVDCTPAGGGGGGAPTTATYITDTGNGTLTSEIVVSNLSQLNSWLGTSIADGAHTVELNDLSAAVAGTLPLANLTDSGPLAGRVLLSGGSGGNPAWTTFTGSRCLRTNSSGNIDVATGDCASGDTGGGGGVTDGDKGDITITAGVWDIDPLLASDFAPLVGGTGIVNSPTGTIAFAATELDALTWGTGGQASFAHTANVSTGTDPVTTYADNSVDWSTPVSATSFTADTGADGENGLILTENATTGRNPGASQVAVSWVTGTGLGIRTASGGAFRKLWHTDAGSLGSLVTCSSGLCTLLDSTVDSASIVDYTIGIADLDASPTPQAGESYFLQHVTGQTGLLLRELNEVRSDISAAYDQDHFWMSANDGYANATVVNSLASLNTAIGSAIVSGPHTTSASDLTSGTLPAARLGTGYVDAVTDLGISCSTNQILKCTGGTSWALAADGGGGGGGAMVHETITSPTSSTDRILFRATEPTILSNLYAALQGTTSLTWDLVYARAANASTVGEVIGTDTVTSSATGGTVSMNAPTIPAGAYVRAKASAANGTPSGLFVQFETATASTTQCNDGVDNADAEDSLIDYPEDPGCSSATDNDETNTDSTAPEAITVASHSFACSGETTTTVDLDWLAPHEDGASGGAVAGYDCRRRAGSTFVEGDWAAATTLTGEPSPGSPGAAQGFTVTGLTGGTQYAFACKSTDEVPNTSAISDAVTCTTTDLGDVFTEDWSLASSDCNLGTCATPADVNNTWTAYGAASLTLEAANNWIDSTATTEDWALAITTETSADESQIGWLCLASGAETTNGYYTLFLRSSASTGSRLAIHSENGGSGLIRVEEWTGSGPTGPYQDLGSLGSNKLTAGNCMWAWIEGTGLSTVIRVWLNETTTPLSNTDPTSWGNADWCIADGCPGTPPSQCSIDCDDILTTPLSGTDTGRRGGFGIFNETTASDERIAAWGFGDPGGN